MRSPDEVIDMLLRINHKLSTPAFAQIVAELERLILSGRLRPGAMIESVRILSLQLKVNPSTVAKAYQALTDRGIMENRPGTGSFVSEGAVGIVRSSASKRLDELAGDMADAASMLGLTAEELKRKVEEAHKRRKKGA